MAEAKVWINAEKNRLYVVLKGFFTEAEAEAAAELSIRTAKRLNPGFDVVTDLSAHKPGSAAGIESTKRVQAFLVKHGMRRIVRIITSSTLSKLQFERTGKAVGYAGDIADVALTIEEADSKLDKLL
jgi:hypothetical protein